MAPSLINSSLSILVLVRFPLCAIATPPIFNSENRSCSGCDFFQEKNKSPLKILDNRQFKNKKKIKNCDYVIYNNKSLKNLKKKVNRLKKRL